MNAVEPQVRVHRLAEQVADHIRARIIRGDFADGDPLPTAEELIRRYPVSMPTFREAMRILEAEGLITVRRGRLGGAIVRRPSPAGLAYNLGLVLASQQVAIGDVAVALRHVEPACAALCASRRDRARAVVPELRELHQAYLDSIEDLVEVVAVSRRFHEALVRLCGNEPLIVLAGALEALWSVHEQDWATRIRETTGVPLKQRKAAGEEHGRILALIEAGDSEGVHRLVAGHLTTAQRNPKPADALVDLSMVVCLKMFDV
ncbi:GntR family transcriptional regulator [Dactylosporangium sp. AC04546]|uniref:FadR/GntR family transcriptional regulator n=1 Tax=Dactylosporangium sp. AC04546 TaxID=2862460 RepID=UPI001EE0BB92|nr:GntR family transcriptional regulator [Dactylosporangium sp. AC04546]WVK87378.1 GntR family transcriptional regulator [Dactylosporangium sp. AC04546]